MVTLHHFWWGTHHRGAIFICHKQSICSHSHPVLLIVKYDQCTDKVLEDVVLVHACNMFVSEFPCMSTEK